MLINLSVFICGQLILCFCRDAIYRVCYLRGTNRKGRKVHKGRRKKEEGRNSADLWLHTPTYRQEMV
ncbi:hypothetical protein [Nodularia sp. NIES-3585]|uniref:hypothetical protein n=1 Tax=Nodularia sp. NIES-3585 TaxID=1973477 RepID=UPI0011320849|nr:hypothetical protein [Nodularia sp. NIES-3585]